MTEYRLVAGPRADLDIAAAYQRYESERAAYDRIAADPLGYQNLESGIRRALLRRFPYAIYFTIEFDIVIVLAVLHVSRDPAEWQRRRRI